MRIIWTLLIVLFAFQVRAEIVGDTITPTSPLDTFAVTDSKYNRGGLMTGITNVSQLTNTTYIGIPVGRRVSAMIAVITNGVQYQLGPDLVTWTRLSTFIPQQFGALGDGIANDTAAFTALMTNATQIASVPAGTYLVDSITVPSGKTLLLNAGAIIKARAYPTGTLPTNESGLPFIRVLSSGSVIGATDSLIDLAKGTIVRPGTYSPFYGIFAQDVEKVFVQGVTVTNGWDWPVYFGRVTNSTIERVTVIKSPQGVGAFSCVNLALNDIRLTDLVFSTAGIYQHCMDVFYGQNVRLNGVWITGVSGTAVGPGYGIFGVTIAGDYRGSFENIFIDGFNAPALVAGAMFIDGGYYTSYRNIRVYQWDSLFSSPIEFQGNDSCLLADVYVDSGQIENANNFGSGMHIAEWGIYSYNQPPNTYAPEIQDRTRSTARGNTFRDMKLTGFRIGIELDGANNKFYNVTANACRLYGLRIMPARVFGESVQVNPIVHDQRGNEFYNCEFSYNWESGVSLTGGSFNLFDNCKFENNNQGGNNSGSAVNNGVLVATTLTGASTSTAITTTGTLTAGAYNGLFLYLPEFEEFKQIISNTSTVITVTNAFSGTPTAGTFYSIARGYASNVVFRNCSFRDTQAYSIAGASLDPSQTIAVNTRFKFSTEYAEQISLGQVVDLVGVMPAAATMRCMVVANSARPDEFYAVPISPTSGSFEAATGVVVNGTGTLTFNVTSTGNAFIDHQVAGSGTIFGTECDGHFWLGVVISGSTEWRRVWIIPNNTALYIEEKWSASFAGAPFVIQKFGINFVPSQRYGTFANRTPATLHWQGNNMFDGNMTNAHFSASSPNWPYPRLATNSNYPSISFSDIYVTANTGTLPGTTNYIPVIITNIFGGTPGRHITILVQDTNTYMSYANPSWFIGTNQVVSGVTSIKGQTGTSTLAANGEVIEATYSGTQWMALSLGTLRFANILGDAFTGNVLAPKFTAGGSTSTRDLNATKLGLKIAGDTGQAMAIFNSGNKLSISSDVDSTPLLRIDSVANIFQFNNLVNIEGGTNAAGGASGLRIDDVNTGGTTIVDGLMFDMNSTNRFSRPWPSYLNTNMSLANQPFNPAGGVYFDATFRTPRLNLGSLTTNVAQFRNFLPTISPDRGDASLTAPTDCEETQLFATPLTSNRSITFSNAGTRSGDRKRVLRLAGGPGILTVADSGSGTIKIIPTETLGFVDVVYGTTNWLLAAYGAMTPGIGVQSTTISFPTILTLASGTSTVTVTGAAVGDVVIANPRTQLTPPLNYYAYVSAANTVTISVQNSTVGSLGTTNVWDLRVERP